MTDACIGAPESVTPMQSSLRDGSPRAAVRVLPKPSDLKEEKE
jgi:hypothetical protein